MIQKVTANYEALMVLHWKINFGTQLHRLNILFGSLSLDLQNYQKLTL
jgi:hypothetical protein